MDNYWSLMHGYETKSLNHNNTYEMYFQNHVYMANELRHSLSQSTIGKWFSASLTSMEPFINQELTIQ